MLREHVKDLDTFRYNLTKNGKYKKLVKEMIDRVTSVHEVFSRSNTEF